MRVGLSGKPILRKSAITICLQVVMGAIAAGFSIASCTSDSDLHAQLTGVVNGV